MGLQAISRQGGIVTTSSLRLVNEGDGNGEIDGPKPPLIEPGSYDLIFVDHETIMLGGGSVSKLVVWFRIATFGPAHGTKLPRYYNVRLEGKPRRHGGFKVGWRSAFVRDYAAATGALPARKNRISMTALEGRDVRGIVRTVTYGWPHRKGEKSAALPPPLYYSVIDRLMLAAVAVAPRPAPVPTPTCNPPEGG